MKPLKPEEAVKLISDQMIETVNRMIRENLKGRYASFRQDELVQKYVEMHHPNASKSERKRVVDELFEKKQLDFEQIYRSLGWKVEYDKPGYNEPGEPVFKFKMKKEHLKAQKAIMKSAAPKAIAPTEAELA